MKSRATRFALALVTLAVSALAQVPPAAAEPDTGDQAASLEVRATLRGDVEITVDDFEISQAALGTMVRESLGCRWQAAESGGGTCRKLLRSGITSAEGRLALAPLVGKLRTAGAMQVSVLLNASGEPATGPGPGWKKKVYKGKAPLIHYQRDYYTFTSGTDAELPPPFTVRMGEAWKPARLAAPFLFVLAGPALLALWLRRRGERKGSPAFAVVWLNWILLAAWLYWFSAVSLTDVIGFSLCLNLENMAAALLIGVALYVLPPLAAAASCVLILAPNSGPDAIVARGRLLKRLLAQEGALLVPLGFFLVGSSMFEYDHRVSMTSLPVAYVLFRILNWQAGRLSAASVWALTGGDLYERVVAIANSAGAKLKGVSVLGTRLAQEANAYATSGGFVLVTSGLVERLTRRELDSVLAHEVGHLRGKHVGVKVTMFWAYFLVVGPAASALLHRAGLPGWLLALPIVPIAYVLAAAQISQRHEFSADARAVEITGDPEGMIASLSRLSRIGSSPVDWGGIQGSILSHPSMKKRVLAIADRFNLPRERALAVLEEPGLIAPNGIASSGGGDAAPAHYALPAGMEAGEPVYNAAARAGHVFWSSWGTRVALVPMLAAMGVLAQRVAPSQFRAVPLFFACIPLAAWLYLRMSNSWDRLFRKSLKRRMGQRLQPEKDAIFVGLAPGDRVYPVGGSYDWDLGFLSLAPDWLSYQGEQARFSVARGAVTSISIEPGPLAWDRIYSVVVKHHGGAFILRRSDAGISLRQARKLSSRLNAWWRPNANEEPATNTPTGGDSPFPPPSLPRWEPVFPSRWKVAFSTAMKAGMLFAGTLIVLATTVPMTQATMMFSLVPLAAPLAYLVAVGPMLFRRRPA